MYPVHYEYDIETAVTDVKRQMGGSSFSDWLPQKGDACWDYGKIGQTGRWTAKRIVVHGSLASEKIHIVPERCPHGCLNWNVLCSGCESGVIPGSPKTTIKVWDKLFHCHFDISAATIDHVNVRDVPIEPELTYDISSVEAEEDDVFDVENQRCRGKAQKDDVSVTEEFLVEKDERGPDQLGIELVPPVIKTKKPRRQIIVQNPWAWRNDPACVGIRWVVESGKYKGQEIGKIKHRKNILRKAVPVPIFDVFEPTNKDNILRNAVPEPANKPSGEVILVNPLPTHLEHGLVTVFGKTDREFSAFGHHGHERASNKTPGRAKADATPLYPTEDEDGKTTDPYDKTAYESATMVDGSDDLRDTGWVDTKAPLFGLPPCRDDETRGMRVDGAVKYIVGLQYAEGYDGDAEDDTTRDEEVAARCRGLLCPETLGLSKQEMAVVNDELAAMTYSSVRTIREWGQNNTFRGRPDPVLPDPHNLTSDLTPDPLGTA